MGLDSVRSNPGVATTVAPSSCWWWWKKDSNISLPRGSSNMVAITYPTGKSWCCNLQGRLLVITVAPITCLIEQFLLLFLASSPPDVSGMPISPGVLSVKLYCFFCCFFSLYRVAIRSYLDPWVLPKLLSFTYRWLFCTFFCDGGLKVCISYSIT